MVKTKRRSNNRKRSQRVQRTNTRRRTRRSTRTNTRRRSRRSRRRVNYSNGGGMKDWVKGLLRRDNAARRERAIELEAQIMAARRACHDHIGHEPSVNTAMYDDMKHEYKYLSPNCASTPGIGVAYQQERDRTV